MEVHWDVVFGFQFVHRGISLKVCGVGLFGIGFHSIERNRGLADNRVVVGVEWSDIGINNGLGGGSSAMLVVTLR